MITYHDDGIKTLNDLLKVHCHLHYKGHWKMAATVSAFSYTESSLSEKDTCHVLNVTPTDTMAAFMKIDSLLNINDIFYLETCILQNWNTCREKRTHTLL